MLLCYVLGLLLVGNTVDAVDQTVVDGASGVDVVDGSLQKMQQIRNLFANDFGLLKRIAWVESNFGENETVISAYRRGGIWQIRQHVYEAIRTSRAARSFTQDAAFNLGRKNTDLSHSNFGVPLRSAFAAQVFLAITQGSDAVPGKLKDQARWWATHYNPGGSTEYFIRKVQEYENTNQCTVRRIDLWFLLDGSGSIGSSNFETSLNFVRQTAAEFSIAPAEVRTGLMIYSSGWYMVSLFNQHTSNQAFDNVVATTRYPGGGTNTGGAISEVNRVGFSVANGARPRTEGVPRILVVLTDGQSGDDVNPPSQQIRQDGVTVFAVGVGQGYNRDELDDIATRPDYVFEFSNFEDLVEILKKEIQTEACLVPVVVEEDSEVSLGVAPGEIKYSSVELPRNGSLNLTFDVTSPESAGFLYFSSTVPNPNAAIHDFAIDLSQGSVDIVINDGGIQGLGGVMIKKRNKRQATDQSLPKKFLYMAIVPKGNSSLNVSLQAKASEVRVNIPTIPPTTTAQTAIAQTTARTTSEATTMFIEKTTMHSTTTEKTTMMSTTGETTTSVLTTDVSTMSPSTTAQTTIAQTTVEQTTFTPSTTTAAAHTTIKQTTLAPTTVAETTIEQTTAAVQTTEATTENIQTTASSSTNVTTSMPETTSSGSKAFVSKSFFFIAFSLALLL